MERGQNSDVGFGDYHMKFVSYLMGHEPHFGLVRDGGVIDLTPRVGDRYPNLRSFIAAPD